MHKSATRFLRMLQIRCLETRELRMAITFGVGILLEGETLKL